MSWVTYPLDELGAVSRGRSRHRPRDAVHLYGGLYPFVQTGDVKKAPLYLKEYTQTYSDAGLAQSKLWPVGTLCVTIAANIAETAILDIKACFPDSIIGFIADPEKADTKFIKYQFDALLKKKMKTVSQGAAQDNLSQAKLLSFDFPVPDVAEQKRISSVLSAYDDLIENNRRRIVLLEEAARLLYREWFVHFRFPGHEHVKIIDGVPDCWRTAKVDGAVKRHPPGKLYSQKTALESGKIPILDQGQSGLIGYHNNEPSFRADIDEPVITFANHTCYQRIIHFSFSAIQNVLPFKPSNSVPSEIYWLHHATEGLVKLNAYKGHWPEFMAKEFTVPTDDVARGFSEIVRPMHLQSHKLQIQNEQLIKARDLLLPRLMDGRLEV